MSGTVIRLIIVGVVFVLLGIYPPFSVFELNLAAFLCVIVAALIAEVVFASRTVEVTTPVLTTRVDQIRRHSRINSTLAAAPTQSSNPSRTQRRFRPAPAAADAPYDPIAASRLQDYYTPTPAPNSQASVSEPSGGDDGGGGGD